MLRNTKLKKIVFSITIDTASPFESKNILKNIWKITGKHFTQDKECLIRLFTSFWCTSSKSYWGENENTNIDFQKMD